MKLKTIAASIGLAAVVLTTGACSAFGGNGGGYVPSYVVGRTLCPDQYGNIQNCVIMSDGDLVVVPYNIWDSIMYGYMYSGSSWYRPSSSYGIHVHSVSVTSYSSYSSTHVGVRPVTPAQEVTQARTGNTYNAGGSSYTSSPVYKARVAATKASSKITHSPTKSPLGGGAATKQSFSQKKTSFKVSSSSHHN